MDSCYQDDNYSRIASKEMETYSLFEANQLLCEGWRGSSQDIEWKKDQISNEEYLRKGENNFEDSDSEGLKGSQADEE